MKPGIVPAIPGHIPAIAAYVARENAVSAKWMMWLGFHMVDDPGPKGFAEGSFYRFEMRRPCDQAMHL